MKAILKQRNHALFFLLWFVCPMTYASDYCSIKLWNSSANPVEWHVNSSSGALLGYLDPAHEGYHWVSNTRNCLKGDYVFVIAQVQQDSKKYISKSPVNNVNKTISLNFPGDFKPYQTVADSLANLLNDLAS